MLEQDDLHVIPGAVGVQVFENDEAMPVTAQRAAALPVVRSWSYPSAADVVGWQPVLASLSESSPAASSVQSGTVFAGYAPAGSFCPDRRWPIGADPSPRFGWAAQYATTKGRAELTLSQFPWVPLAVLAEVLVWVVFVTASFVGRRRTPRPTRAAGSAP